MSQKKISYENALNRAKLAADGLENGDVTLEQALSLYKEGIEMLSYMKSEIEKAKEQFVVLKKQFDGTFEEKALI